MMQAVERCTFIASCSEGSVVWMLRRYRPVMTEL